MADRGMDTAPTIKSANKINEVERRTRRRRRRRSKAAAPPLEKPELRDCSGNGCFPCVWNVYSDKEEVQEINIK
ncbi:hypothetical protein D8674_033955 [Pyrus ussuriensis x Pyrus communis]|uniref:Uncharacterized protein n=1 Tax=Pyrus ussuriensis x Pyrus communis TaxID=2448454 RepID=A0A5N5HUE1_9ROSA|nr:hypothetical protein D8674_033955 [Pyrus ussuriensis x Pyrus communis]